MSKGRAARFFLLCGLVLTLGSASHAQVTTGTPPLGSFAGGPDAINLANLNSVITIPVLQKAGRGLPFIYNLNYNSSVWTPVGSSGSQTWQAAGNFGWNGPSGKGYISSHLGTLTTCIEHNRPVPAYWTYTNFVYVDGYGTSHTFAGSDTFGEGGLCGFAFGWGAFSITSTDGSGYTLSMPGGSSAFNVIGRGGSVVQITGLGSGPLSGGSVDSNGNEITLSSTGVFTDTLGQTALTVAGSRTPTSPTTFTYTPPGGTNVAYTMNYTSYTVATNFGVSGIVEYGATAVPLVSSIALPDGTQYSFTYEPTPSTPAAGACTPIAGTYATNCVTGRLASVQFPTGGTITYAYTGGNNGILSDGSAAGLTRTTPDGTWTYARSGSGTAWTTTITDPSTPHNQTVLMFQSVIPVAGSPAFFYETERQVYQGSTSGTLLQTTYTCYNAATSPCNATAITQPISFRTVNLQLLGGLQSRSDTSYNGFGLATELDEYAYASGPPSSIVRKTIITYASLSNGIVSMPASVTVKDGITVKAQTTYCYDEATPSGTSTCSATGAPATTTGTPQHVAVSGSRGNVTTIALFQGSTTLGKKFTYYDTGTVHTSTDANGAVTTNTYGTSSCGNSFVTSVTEPLSLSRSMVWNCTGGVETSGTDENLKITSLTYNDPDFWRPNKVTDAASNVATLTYTGATSVESSLPFNGSISTSDALITLDTLGRVHVAQVKESPSSSTYDSQETDYNAVGLPSKWTLPYPGLANATNSTAPNLTATYDALGRILQSTDSGGGTASYSYNENDVLITSGPPPTGENTKRKQYEYDALGRLTSVCEITGVTGSASCAQNTVATGFLTKYTYDVNNNLIGVTQNAQASTTQTRTYAYDFQSRLTSELNPESGTTSYVYDSDSTCGTSATDLGSLVKKTDAVGNVICYLHDSLRRVTSITYPSGSYAANTSNKYFVYDSATVNGVAMANSKTRLAEAYTAATSTGTKITDLGYSYSVRGEVSTVYESTPHSGGYYTMNATYWPNGALDQIGGLPTLPTLTYTPDGEGRPAVVTASAYQNPVSATQYNAASQPTSMTLGSTDSDSFTYDPNTNRMKQFQFNVNSQSLTGNIVWNALGTPSSLDITDAFNSVDNQNCSFAHDDLTRLATVNCGTIWGQSFSYDAFGNISKTVLSGSSGTSFQPTYATPSTNRIASLPSFTPTYDANGNLTKDPQHQYGWDSEGRPVAIDTVTLTYDALDRMVEQNNSGAYTQIVYDPLGEKFALMNAQTLKKAFAPLPDGGIAVYNSTSLAYYRHPDRLGSSRLASTPTRGIYSDTAYAPFGEPYAQTGTADPSFTGQNQDTASNLYDFLYREHSPIEGRWISPDPAGLAAVSLTDPQSWNRYAYVRNLPLGLEDSNGMGYYWLGNCLYYRQYAYVNGQFDSSDDFFIGCTNSYVNSNSSAGSDVRIGSGGELANNSTTPKTSCETATDAANQALDNSNAAIGATTAQQGVPTLDWALLTSEGYWFRGLTSGGAVSAGGLLAAAGLGAMLKGSYYFGKGVILQTVDSGKVVVAQIKANLACEGSPISLPDFGLPPGSD
jgi:RHS repeat-associated protein